MIKKLLKSTAIVVLQFTLTFNILGTDGTIDLTDWNYETTEIKGKWKHYPNALLTPQELGSSPEFILLPHFFEGTGFETYSINLITDDASPRLALLISQIYTSYNLYVNGKLLKSVGRPSKTKDDSLPGSGIDFTVLPETNRFEITLQVANFSHHRGGIKDKILIGELKTIIGLVNFNKAYNSILLGALLTFTLSGLTLFVLYNKEKSTLYFSLVCLFIGVYLTAYRSNITFITAWIQWEIILRTLYLTTFTIPYLLLKFLNELFVNQCPKIIITLSKIITVVHVLAALLFDSGLLTRSIYIFFIYASIIALVNIYVMIKSCVNRLEDSALYLVTTSVFCITYFLDLLQFSNLFSKQVNLIPSGLFVMLLGMSVTISRRFSRSFYRVEEQSEELTRLHKLKDEFLANTSHELKTPLNGIMGIAESILDFDESRLKGELTSNINIILHNSRRLSNLVNDLLDNYALKHGSVYLDIVPVNLFDIVEQSKLLFSALVKGKGIDLINQVNPGTPNVLADPSRLQQILHNLIHNAIKFVDEGSITIHAQKENNRVKITVSDTGKGIHPNDQEKIFESFKKIGKTPGTGLGLSITADLVRLHGSEMTLISSLEEGAAFSFYLETTSEPPMLEHSKLTGTIGVDESYQAKSNVSASPTKKPIASPTVLIVDDDPTNLQILRNHLSKYRILEANSGDEALVCLEKEHPDLILLDIMMPGINGIDTCKIIRKQFSQTELPVIFLTAKNRLSDLTVGFNVGGNDYIPKPYYKEELLSRVESLLSTLRGTRHLVNINLFANSISNINDTSDLAKALLKYLSHIPSFTSVEITKNGKLMGSLSQEKNLKGKKSKVEEKVLPIDKLGTSQPDSNLLCFHFDELDEFVYIANLNEELMKMDLEFLKALNKQSILVRRNLAKIFFSKEKLPIYYDIYKKLNRIDFIKYESGFSTLYGTKMDQIGNAYEISLKELKLVFPDIDLLKCRRNYLVNPKKIIGVKKLSHKSYEYRLVGDRYVPIGKTFISLAKRTHPQYF